MSRFEVRFFDPGTGHYVSRVVEALSFDGAVRIATDELYTLHVVAADGPKPEPDLVRRIR